MALAVEQPLVDFWPLQPSAGSAFISQLVGDRAVEVLKNFKQNFNLVLSFAILNNFSCPFACPFALYLLFKL
jgi:hypothetical protein